MSKWEEVLSLDGPIVYVRMEWLWLGQWCICSDYLKEVRAVSEAIMWLRDVEYVHAIFVTYSLSTLEKPTGSQPLKQASLRASCGCSSLAKLVSLATRKWMCLKQQQGTHHEPAKWHANQLLMDTAKWHANQLLMDTADGDTPDDGSKIR